jgi:hypothetical protein
MNLLQLVMIIKNGESLIERCLESYLGVVDRFVILDTGSSDSTIRLIKKFKKDNNANVIIHQESFKGFSESRNRCLDLAYSNEYMWQIMVDDSYVLHGDLRSELIMCNKNMMINAMSICINHNSINYKSTRITRVSSKLRYVGEIHEVLNIKSAISIRPHICIEDVACDNHIARTKARMFSDLRMINHTQEYDEGRRLYIKANIICNLYRNGMVPINVVLEAYKARIDYGGLDLEEMFMTICAIGHLYCEQIQKFKNDPDMNHGDDYDNIYNTMLKYYVISALTFPARAGESYFFIYMINGSEYYINKAYEYRCAGHCRLPIDLSIYSNNGNYGHIENQYRRYYKKKLSNEIKSHFLVWNENSHQSRLD